MKFLLKSVIFFVFVLSFAFLSKNTAHAVYPLGTEVVFYNCEEDATGTTTDVTTATTTNSGSGGSTYNGTMGGNASTSALVAKFGSRSCSFGETGDYMKTYFGSSTDPTTSSISVSMWVYKKESANGCNTGDADHFFGSSGQPSGSRFYLRCNPVNHWGMRFGAAAAADATTSVAHQTWEHIVLVFDSANDTPKMYVNNVLRATSALVSSYTIHGDFYLGMANDTITTPGVLNLNEGANAYIDDIAFYSTALSAGDISTLYNAGVTPGQPTGLAATPYENKVFLSWTSPGGTFDDYKVEYKLTSEPTTWTTFSDGVSTVASTTVTGLVNGSSYDFRVSTLNNGIPGTVSATITTIPWYRIAFVSPTTVTAGATTSATFATAYASTTFATTATASTTHTLRLETGTGSLVSQVSTTTRYGDRNLTHLAAVGESDLSILDNSSGIAYVQTTDTLFVVHNRAVGTDSTIDELDKNGTLIRAITCTSCGDIEGITLISSVASTTAGGVYDHTFMISTENNLSNAEIFRVVIPSPAASTTALTKNNNFLTGINHGSNLGLEGIAYNSTSGVFYVAREKNVAGNGPGALYEVTLGSGQSTATSTICGNLDFSTIATDFSDLNYYGGVLYVLSHENNRLIPLDISSTSTCKYVDSDGDNGGVSSTSIDTDDFLNTLIAGSPNQPEGVTWDVTGDYLYVLAEADFLKKYRTTTFTIKNTFTGLTSGSYALKSTFLDTNGVTANASQLNFGIDITGPVISNIASSSATATGTVTWDTNEAATSKVSYGTVSGTYTISTSSSPLVTSPHTIGLTGLSAGTRYYFVVVSADSLGNYSTSSEQSITTASDIDVVSPSVTLTAPSNATVVSGASVALTASASDNVAVAGVKFYVDGVLNGSEDTVSAYTGTWDSTAVADGSHTIIAVARDTSNNYATSSSAIVTVDNTAPSRSGGTPSGTLAFGTIGTTVGLNTDETATCKYSTSPGTAYGSMTVFTSTNSTTHSASITGLSNGTSYTYYVKCSDGLSNINATDYSISFSVAADSTAPSATLTAPLDGATVSGSSVSLAATASDDVSVAGVKFYVDGVLNGSEDTVSAYTGTWDSTLASEGTHTISAVARDTNNNYGTSTSVTVTVDNTTPPVLSAGSPSGTIAAGTTATTLSLSTNETATCKYSTSPGTSYGSMTAFTSTNSTTHSASITGLSNGTSYTYYVKCSDSLSNTNVSDYSISFAVASPDADGGTRSGSSSTVRRALAALGLTTTPSVSPNNPSVPGAPFVRPLVTRTSALSRPLYFGLANEQVRTLQKVLNGSADTQVSLTGPGSPGNETSLYLTKTKDAVKKFQLKYKLVTNVNDPGFGYVGPSTRKKINELLYN